MTISPARTTLAAFLISLGAAVAFMPPGAVVEAATTQDAEAGRPRHLHLPGLP